MGHVVIPDKPGVLSCDRAMAILVYVEARYPDHAARADGYGNRWRVTITSRTETDGAMRETYRSLLDLELI